MSKFKPSIPHPCHQNWDNMILEKGGRYCNSCDKVVIDFTKIGDKELLQYFSKNSSTEICGLVNTTQIEAGKTTLTGHFIRIKERIETIKINPVRSFSLFALAFVMTLTGCKAIHTLGVIIAPNHFKKKDAHNNVRSLNNPPTHSKDSSIRSK